MNTEPDKEPAIVVAEEFFAEELNDAETEALKGLLTKLGLKDVTDVKSVNGLADLLPLKLKTKTKVVKASIEDDEDEVRVMPQPQGVPKLTWFSGTEPVTKGYMSFDAWKFEVEGLLGLHPMRASTYRRYWMFIGRKQADFWGGVA